MGRLRRHAVSCRTKLNLPFAVNLFIGNIFSVGLTGFMVPWVANRMGWWMFPKGNVLGPTCWAPA